MRSKNFRLGIALALCAGLVSAGACSDDDDINVSVSTTNFCTEVADVICFNMFNCCTGAEIEKVLGQTITTTEQTCRRDVDLICQEKHSRLIYALRKGTASVATDKATRCLMDLMFTGTCFQSTSQEPWKTSCLGEEDSMSKNLFTGLQAAGTACTYDVECVKDSRCAADRTCKALPKAGEACASPGNLCAESSYCSTTNSRCAALKTAGQDCSTSSECAKKHFCNIDTTTSKGKCKALQTAGASCTSSTECDSGLCIPGTCSSGGKSCYKDSECSQVCKNSPTTACTSDQDCEGKCANSGNPCWDDYSCNTSTSEKCLTDTCPTVKCSGKPACGDTLLVVDFCADPTKVLLGI